MSGLLTILDLAGGTIADLQAQLEEERKLVAHLQSVLSDSAGNAAPKLAGEEPLNERS